VPYDFHTYFILFSYGFHMKTIHPAYMNHTKLQPVSVLSYTEKTLQVGG
jgi:hypothetical protein